MAKPYDPPEVNNEATETHVISFGKPIEILGEPSEHNGQLSRTVRDAAGLVYIEVWDGTEWIPGIVWELRKRNETQQPSHLQHGTPDYQLAEKARVRKVKTSHDPIAVELPHSAEPIAEGTIVKGSNAMSDVTSAKIAEIELRHKDDPVFKFRRVASSAVWGSIDKVAKFFLNSLRHVRTQNPVLGLLASVGIFLTAFIVVPPLYLIIGPILEIAFLIIGMLALIVRLLVRAVWNWTGSR